MQKVQVDLNQLREMHARQLQDSEMIVNLVDGVNAMNAKVDELSKALEKAGQDAKAAESKILALTKERQECDEEIVRLRELVAPGLRFPPEVPVAVETEKG